jgi:hypothetical protein
LKTQIAIVGDTTTEFSQCPFDDSAQDGDYDADADADDAKETKIKRPPNPYLIYCSALSFSEVLLLFVPLVGNACVSTKADFA